MANEMQRQEFWEALRTLGLNQTQCADMLGISLRTVQRYYTGHSPIPVWVERVLRTLVQHDIKPKWFTNPDKVKG